MPETSFAQDSLNDTLTYSIQENPDSIVGDTVSQDINQAIFEQTIVPKTVYREELQRKNMVEAWQISLIVCLLILLAWVRSSISGVIQSGFSFLVKQRMTEQNEGRSFINNAQIIVATLSTFIASSLIIYKIIDSENLISNEKSPLAVFGILILMFIGVEIIRIGFILCIGILTKSQPDCQKFILQRNSNLNISLFILIPCAAASLVTSGQNLRIVAIIAFSIVILMLGVGLTKGIQTIKSKVFPIYYLILYICSLEIIPVMWGLYIAYANV